MLDDGNQKPQCVFCNVVLRNKAMEPSKLKRHLQQKHPEHVDKDLWFFQKQKLSLKRLKLDTSGYFQQQSTASVKASFEVVLRIVGSVQFFLVCSAQFSQSTSHSFLNMTNAFTFFDNIFSIWFVFFHFQK